jgi:hypothetical protein
MIIEVFDINLQIRVNLKLVSFPFSSIPNSVLRRLQSQNEYGPNLSGPIIHVKRGFFAPISPVYSFKISE